MPAAEFNEREFEFCVNHELVQILGAYLVGGLPSIPSQVEEALGGYDAAYEFHSGKTLFLQYKVAHYADRPWGAGASTFHLWNGPYFRARLHRHPQSGYDQHNRLVALANAGDFACYCAPRFYKREDLGALFRARRSLGVTTNVLLAPLAGAPVITDRNAHSMSYPDRRLAFRLHSDPSEEFEGTSLGDLVEQLPREQWGTNYFTKLLDRLQTLVDTTDKSGDTPANTDLGPVEEIARVLDDHFGAVMALFPQQASPEGRRSMPAGDPVQ
jgi:hypothetical protein